MKYKKFGSRPSKGIGISSSQFDKTRGPFVQYWTMEYKCQRKYSVKSTVWKPQEVCTRAQDPSTGTHSVIHSYSSNPDQTLAQFDILAVVMKRPIEHRSMSSLYRSLSHLIASNRGKINQVPQVDWCEGGNGWAICWQTTLFVSLREKKSTVCSCCCFLSFFNRFLAGARGSPPYPLSLRCLSFVLTNGWCLAPDGSDWTQVDTQAFQAYILVLCRVCEGHQLSSADRSTFLRDLQWLKVRRSLFRCFLVCFPVPSNHVRHLSSAWSKWWGHGSNNHTESHLHMTSPLYRCPCQTTLCLQGI